MELPEFQSFRKIPRFYRDIVVSEKIDGTNAQILIPADTDQPIVAGSRNRWITPEDDNFGFARWVQENQDMLRRLGPGRHFGEWFGSGIQRRYGLDHKRFALFNTSRWLEGFPEGLPSNVCTVPVLYHGPFDSSKIEDTLLQLKNTGSIAVPGWMQPEGVVIYHCQSGQLYKYTIDDKDGTERTKPKKRGPQDTPPSIPGSTAVSAESAGGLPL